jgi:hypothetical protein
MKPQNPIRHAIGRALSGFFAMLPVLLGVLLLSSLLQQFVPQLLASGLMGVHRVSDALIGAAAGSIAAGQPTVSYVLGGELLKGGVGLAAVSALVVAWVTVGLSHLPLESVALGRRFAALRNLLSFLFAVVGALLISGAVHVFG